MMEQQPRPAREARDAERNAGHARTELFRALDRALDEVRMGLAVDARDRHDASPQRRIVTRIAPNR